MGRQGSLGGYLLFKQKPMFFIVYKGDGQGKWRVYRTEKKLHVLIFLQDGIQRKWHVFFFWMADRDLKLVFFFPRWRTETMLRIFFLFKMAHRDNDMRFFLKWRTETLKFVFFFKMADGDNHICLFSRWRARPWKLWFFSRWRTEIMTRIFFKMADRALKFVFFFQDSGQRQWHLFFSNWGTKTMKPTCFLPRWRTETKTHGLFKMGDRGLKTCFLFSKMADGDSDTCFFFKLGDKVWNPLVFYQDGGRRQRHTFFQNGEQRL